MDDTINRRDGHWTRYTDMMDNYKIRQFEDSIIDMFNKSDLQIEIKRMVAQNVLNLLTKKADEIIMHEIAENKKEEE